MCKGGPRSSGVRKPVWPEAYILLYPSPHRSRIPAPVVGSPEKWAVRRRLTDGTTTGNVLGNNSLPCLYFLNKEETKELAPYVYYVVEKAENLVVKMTFFVAEETWIMKN